MKFPKESTFCVLLISRCPEWLASFDSSGSTHHIEPTVIDLKSRTPTGIRCACFHSTFT